jgi:hypothetical protein
MASRMDERGYVENGNPRQREPLPGQDNDQEPRRMSDRNRRRDEREFDRGNERDQMRDQMEDDRGVRGRGNEHRREQLPLRLTSNLSDAFVTAFERGAQALGENMRMYQDETVRFMTRRLEQDTEMLEQLGRSRSVFDLFTIQQKWLSAATRAYGEEFMRLSKLAGDTSQRAVHETRSALDDTRSALDDTRAAMNEARRGGGYDAQ